MPRLLRLTRTGLILVAVFALLRLAAELAALPSSLSSEISVDRLLAILPVFLGLRLAREGTDGFGMMVVANAMYVGWATVLVSLITVLDHLLELGTHFQHGALGPHLLGHLVHFILLCPIAVLVCWLTYRISRPSSSEQPRTAESIRNP